MAFKKITNNTNEEIFETKVSDGTGKLLSKWKCVKSDYPKVYKILTEKFDIKEKKKRNIDWAL